MSLVIYTDLKYCDSKSVIKDCEPYFVKFGIENTNYNNFVLKEIELGSYYSKNYFIDRFGVKLSIENLSTTSKLAMLINKNLDYIFDLSEAGLNTGYVLTFISNGSVYSSISSLKNYDWGYKDKEVDIVINNKKFDKLKDFCYYVMEVL